VDRRQDLSDVLVELARTLGTDFSIQTILDHLVLRIVDVLPIDGAGVTLINSRLDPHYVAASNPAALRFEKLQSELGEGPCLEAYSSGGAVTVPDLRQDARFSRFGPRAVEDGLAAVFAFPLRANDQRLGALDLYRDLPGTMDPGEMGDAQTLADVASAYLFNANARADLREASERFRESSLHDDLTGLPNRLLLRQRLDHAALRARRSRKLVAVLFIDLDRFKQVNDRFGHHVGDDLLVAVAERLTHLLRPGDTLARLSGDEFVILCDDLDQEDQAQVVARRIRAALEAPFPLRSAEVRVTASVGIAFAGRGEDVPDEVLQRADAAMYEVKRQGGAHRALADQRRARVAEEEATLERELHGAAARGELRADYQPIVTTADGHIAGVEALLRWDHPTRGLVPPSAAVPLAERSGLISEIGRWMLERACLDRPRNGAAGPVDDLQVYVNVSAHQLVSPGFPSTVASLLDETDTPPGLVTLEVTETAFVVDERRAAAVLDDLKELGVMLALDDFGTAYSSLSYLRRFPVDVLKIDQSFIGQLGRGDRCSKIVAAVVDLAHSLDMTVVAEGVETAAQHEAVAALGCDTSQGYYFARPMSADALDARLRPGTKASRHLPQPAGTSSGPAA